MPGENTVNNAFTNANGMNPIIFSKKVALEYTKLSYKTLEYLTNDQWEGEIKNEGDRVRIVIPNVEGIKISKGNACPVPQATPPEALDLVIDKTQTFALAITDKEKAQTQFKNWMDGMANGVAQKVGRIKNQEVIRDIFEYTPGAAVAGVYNPANHPLAGDFGTDAAPINLTPQNAYQFLLQVKMALVDSGAMDEDGTYDFKPLNQETQEMRGVFICGTRLAAILLSAYQLAGRSTAAGDIVVKDGVVDRVAGLDVRIDRTLDMVYTTAGTGTEMPVADREEAADANRKLFVNLPFLAGTKNAITKASQVSKVENVRDPYCFQDIVRGMELYGYKILHPEALVRGVVKKLAFDEFNTAIPVVVEGTVNTKEQPAA